MTNIKDKSNSAAVYAGSYPTLNNPLFSVQKKATNHEEEFNAMVLLVVRINMIGIMLLNTVHLPEGHKNMQN